MKREQIIAALRPALDGPMPPGARKLIVNGEHARFADTRALVDQILTSRPELIRLARKRWLELRDQVGPTEAEAILRREFPSLKRLKSVMAKNPPGWINKSDDKICRHFELEDESQSTED